MRVLELARREQVNANTIRHYVRIGLLNPGKDDSGYHRFTAAEHKRLRFILQARNLGFTLDNIRIILQAAEQGESPCSTVRQLIEPRLSEARIRLAAMQALVGRMERAVEQWAEQPDCVPCGEHICHLIEDADVHLTEPCASWRESQHD